MNTAIDKEQIINFILERLAHLSKIPQQNFEITKPLANYGIDSIHALSLCSEIEEWLDIDLEPTLTWDYPTIELMANFIHSEITLEN